MKCCICGKEIVGYGHNPYGCLDEHDKPIKWKDTDRCCEACNDEFVIAGRLHLLVQERNRKNGKDN